MITVLKLLLLLEVMVEPLPAETSTFLVVAVEPETLKTTRQTWRKAAWVDLA